MDSESREVNFHLGSAMNQLRDCASTVHSSAPHILIVRQRRHVLPHAPAQITSTLECLFLQPQVSHTCQTTQQRAALASFQYSTVSFGQMTTRMFSYRLQNNSA